MEKHLSKEELEDLLREMVDEVGTRKHLRLRSSNRRVEGVEGQLESSQGLSFREINMVLSSLVEKISF